MCGIFGYSGSKNASEIILDGLKRLEYRGYDSWGIAILADQIKVQKQVGAIGDLISLNSELRTTNSQLGIGHTRWATHGGISETNAHPHFSSDKSFTLAQNGIVENYQHLKSDLQKKGYKFETETDTEVIVRLIEEKLASHIGSGNVNLKDAVRQAFLDLEGRNTIILLTNRGEIIAARNGSPLVVGLNGKEVFFSSDTLSFAPYASDFIVVENGQMVSYNGKLDMVDIKSNKALPLKQEKINLENSKVDKEGYDHFMLKEIHESPYVVTQVLNQNSESSEDFIKALKEAKNIYTIGSGTTGIAASQIAFYLRAFSRLNARAVIGADIYDYYDLLTENDLVIAPSQSGETADVLEVLEIAKKKGVKIASYVNMPGSTMTRISDYKFMALAGPEICVMSTKVFVSQLAWGYLLSKIVAGKGDDAIENLHTLSEQLSTYLNNPKTVKEIQKVAKSLIKPKDIFLLGKFQNFNIAKEGMVKLIEGSYKHAHAIPAGDLKHYAITLMEPCVPVITIVSEDVAKVDILSAIS